ncbi:helix-turn-helix domain-containing protein [Falsirhodobacter sp. alg1]|uniref:helix-turn-helix domain-containing protein n=1 Tax=Falsirhodobacter sp. alg1 TaxID=1472418 RepID=UPI00178CCE42|nr:helix-turn-helix domain-containing protein [Falsirhodobacter sp. alg1]
MSAERTLQILEYLMASGSRPVKQVDIARDLDMSSATLNRIIRTMSDRGYLFRTSEKYCIPNFQLLLTVPMSDRYLAVLNTRIAELATKVNASVEVIVIVGHELLWHSCVKHPDPQISIRAKAGFRRGIYELDALATLYLASLPQDHLKDQVALEGFFQTGQDEGSKISILGEAEVCARIEDARGAAFLSDPAPNHLGIRRFAMPVFNHDGSLLHLLSIADKVAEGVDEAAMLELYRNELLSVGETLQAQLASEADENRLSRNQGRLTFEGLPVR